MPMPMGSPDRTSLLNSVRLLCPDIPSDVLQDFFARMDQEYFRRFEPQTIAEHVRLT
jgi:glutamate-ammonia-ligase adenylyltransferase